MNFLQKVKKVLAVWNKFLFLHQLNSILLTVKIHKSWQLRKKLQKKLQRKPLLRRRKLQRRRNNFSFLEAKNIKVLPIYREDFFLYLPEGAPHFESEAHLPETRSPPAFQNERKMPNAERETQNDQYKTRNAAYKTLNVFFFFALSFMRSALSVQCN